MASRFEEVLSAAISDFVEHGFTSVDRIERWTDELRRAAAQSLKPQAEVDRMVARGLEAIYRRLVDNGGVIRFAAVPRFKLEQIRPSLRAELDRRILASANLIKLNRAQAIETTIRRFQGWATSIPAGGTANASRRDVKIEIKKAMSQLPYAERRVAIDQGHKLNSSISQIVASQSGAIAAEWHSHWRQAGYNFREDHKERDLNIYLLNGSWAAERGLVKPGPAGWWDSITKPAEEPFCRCFAKWIYGLGQLPDEMLTQKGRDELSRVREQLAG